MKRKTNSQKVAIIQEVARVVGGTVREDYIGRGMYGRSCVGIECRDGDIARSEASDRGLRGAAIDSLGLDYIVYWPNVKPEKEISQP